MKRLTLKLSLLAFVLFSVTTSCDKVKDLVTINVNVQSTDVEFLVQPTDSGKAVLAEFGTALNIDSLIKEGAGTKYGIANIKSVKLQSISLAMVTNAESANSFGNITSCKAELASNTKPTLVTISALASNPDVTASTLVLPANSTLEMKDYFSATSFSYKLSGELRKPVTKTLTCKATIKYQIKVGL